MGDITRTKASVRPLGRCMYSENTEAGDTIEAGEIVYLNGTSGWVLADGSAAASLAGEIGIVVAPQDSVDGDTGLSVLLKGKVTGFAAMDPGALHYASDTAGEIADAAGSVTKIVGYADSATVLMFDPNTPANPS